MRSTSLTIVQGTPFKRVIRLTQKENGVSAPFSLVGCTVKLQARNYIDAEDTVLDISSDTHNIVVDPADGSFLIALSSEETSALSFGMPYSPNEAVYQCEITRSSGETIRILAGKIKLDREVVR